MLSDSVISDPLSEYSSISIFSRALKASGTDTTSTCADDIDFMHSHLKSMELQSPQKLLEQAKTIVAGGMEFSAMNIQYNTYSQKVKENRNEQRPDLGRKRARFSLNPNLGKPTVNLETNFDIDQLQDPDEYFMAYEKLENARKELRRQGVDIPVNNIDSSRQKMSSKQSRPGMFRKPVAYTHRYLPMVSDMEGTDLHTTDPISHKYEPEIVVQSATNNEIGSHEVLFANIKKEESSDILDELMSSKIEDLDGDATVSFLQEHLNLKPIDVAKLQISDLPEARRSSFMFSGSKMMMLGTDLSGVKNMMRTHNNEISKQEVPDAEISMNPSPSLSPVKSPSEILHGLEDHLMQPNTNSNKIEKSFPKVAKRSVNKTEPHDTKMDSLDYKSPETRVSEKFRRSLASPLLHKSPLAAMQSLKKQLAQSSMRAYSFSTMDPDSSPEKNPETVVKRGSEIIHGDTETNQKDYMSFGTRTTYPSRHLFRSPSPPPHQTPLDSVGAHGTERKSTLFPLLNSDLFLDRNATIDVTDSDGTEQPATGTGLTDSANIVINNEHDASTYVNSSEFLNENSSEQYDLKKPKETDSVLSPDVDVSKSNRINLEDGFDEQLDNHISGTNSVTYKKNVTGNGNASDKVGSNRNSGAGASDKGLLIIDYNKVSETSVEDGVFPSDNDAGKIEVNGDACTTGELRSDNHVSAVTVVNNKRRQQKYQKEKRKKETLKRHSLAEIGTTWEAGVRRGTRIRMRPLEYWKGERFLYGRVHESLVTVIGVKYMSPSTKGDIKPMKVQSYVPDNFKGLVEQAALH